MENTQQTRLIAAAEQRKKLKEDTARFADLFGVFVAKFDELNDDMPLVLRRIMKDLWESEFNQNVLEKGTKKRASPPTDEEKLTRPKEYARCETCEKVIQIRLMKLHQQRAICVETAKTRFTDVKLVKATKDKTDMPRVRVKERIALMAEYNDLTEKQVVNKIVKKKPMIDKALERNIEWWEQMERDGEMTEGGKERLKHLKQKKLSEDFIEESDDDEVAPVKRVLTPILEDKQVPPPSYEEEFVPIPVPAVVAEPVAEIKKIVIKKKLNIKRKGKLIVE